MDYPYRVFYRTRPRGNLTVVDARVVERGGDERVFHTDDDTVRAIKSSDDETTVLDGDGETEETTVEYVWEKLNEHELYIFGAGYYATECTVRYRGDYNGKYKSDSGVDLRVNSTEISGSGDFDNNWDWGIMSEGGASLVEINNELSEFFGKECVYVGYEDEIDTFEYFGSLI